MVNVFITCRELNSASLNEVTNVLKALSGINGVTFYSPNSSPVNGHINSEYKKLLDTDIRKLELSTRLRDALWAHNIESLGKICVYTEKELGRMRGIGVKCLSELKQVIAKNKLAFGLHLEDYGYVKKNYR